jgi:hypothetical protein
LCSEGKEKLEYDILSFKQQTTQRLDRAGGGGYNTLINKGLGKIAGVVESISYV